MTVFVLAGHSNDDSGAVGVGGRQENRETVKLRDAIVRHLPFGHPNIVDRDYEDLRAVLRRIQTGSGSVVLDIHFNASTNTTATGVEVFVGDDAQANDLLLAHDVLNATVKHLGVKNRGVKTESESARKRLGVMREHGAVCLLEVCFITNESDMATYDAVYDNIAKDLAAVLVKHDAMAT